jgi:hypothetical protein
MTTTTAMRDKEPEKETQVSFEYPLSDVLRRWSSRTRACVQVSSCSRVVPKYGGGKPEVVGRRRRGPN